MIDNILCPSDEAASSSAVMMAGLRLAQHIDKLIHLPRLQHVRAVVMHDGSIVLLVPHWCSNCGICLLRRLSERGQRWVICVLLLHFVIVLIYFFEKREKTSGTARSTHSRKECNMSPPPPEECVWVPIFDDVHECTRRSDH